MVTTLAIVYSSCAFLSFSRHILHSPTARSYTHGVTMSTCTYAVYNAPKREKNLNKKKQQQCMSKCISIGTWLLSWPGFDQTSPLIMRNMGCEAAPRF